MDSEALTQLGRLTGVRSLSLNQVKMGKQQRGIKAAHPVKKVSADKKGKRVGERRADEKHDRNR